MPLGSTIIQFLYLKLSNMSPGSVFAGGQEQQSI